MLFVLLAAAGCDRVFALIEVPPDAPGRLADARPDGTPDAFDVGCFSDDFSGSSIDRNRWPSVDEMAGTQVGQTGGLLSFTLVTASTYAYSTISTGPRDLTNDAIEVEIAELPTGTGAELGITAGIDKDNRYVYFFSNGSIGTRVTVDGTNGDSQRSVTAADRYVRISFEGNKVAWSHSANRVDWITERTGTTLVPVDALNVALFAGTYQQEPTPGSPKLDNFALICLP